MTVPLTSNPGPQPFMRGTLWQRLVETTQSALACGALHSIATNHEWLEQGGLNFIVRISLNLARKQAQAVTTAGQIPQPHNPFLPYDPALYVADLLPTHVALLNKFNVVDHHLLIITRAFESQEAWLTEADFLGLAIAMAEVEGLGFYNGGQRAGASQPHKHLQLVPLPLVKNQHPLPLDALIQECRAKKGPQHCPHLPFKHQLLWLNLDWSQSPEHLAPYLLTQYQTLCSRLDIGEHSHRPTPATAYNLLVTRQWMLIVPRRQEAYANISVNALGFAGSLFVRNAAQLEQLKALGPLHLLQQVAHPI